MFVRLGVLETLAEVIRNCRGNEASGGGVKKSRKKPQRGCALRYRRGC